MVDELDPQTVIAFLAFLASFAAGQELAQMTVKRKPKPKFRPDQKGAALALVLVLAVLFLMYAFG